MTATAKLTVTRGAERGKVFVLNGELVHVGRSPENQVVLSDPLIAEHQVTIANRNGKFAIYVSGDRSVQIDGQPVPAEQWIWLPGQASLQFTAETALQFQRLDGESPADPATETRPAAETGSVISLRKSDRRRSAGKKAEPVSRVVAKFITDRTGETLVRLGEDGQLPELALSEGGKSAKPGAKTASKGNPALIYAALGFSVLASILMLTLEPESSSGTGKAAARKTILRDFVGQEGQPLKPYQQLLRDAELAHSRRDGKEEKEAYRKVLRLLNSEDRNPLTGVTGHVEDDERLRKLLAVLMGSG